MEFLPGYKDDKTRQDKTIDGPAGFEKAAACYLLQPLLNGICNHLSQFAANSLAAQYLKRLAQLDVRTFQKRGLNMRCALMHLALFSSV